MTKGKYTKGFTFTKGFTLVELLVVIAIIAILAGALFMVINPAKLLAKSRDSKRISEITELNKAIAASLADGKITKPTSNTGVRSSCAIDDVSTDGTGWAGGWINLDATGIRSYMGVLPRDPKANPNVSPNCYYFAMNTAGDWEINAVLESFDNASLAINDGGNQGSTNTCTARMPIATCRYEVGSNVPSNVM